MTAMPGAPLDPIAPAEATGLPNQRGGTLAISREVPVGLTEITLKFDVDCDADAAKLERMIQTTERYYTAVTSEDCRKAIARVANVG